MHTQSHQLIALSLAVNSVGGTKSAWVQILFSACSWSQVQASWLSDVWS